MARSEARSLLSIIKEDLQSWVYRGICPECGTKHSVTIHNTAIEQHFNNIKPIQFKGTCMVCENVTVYMKLA